MTAPLLAVDGGGTKSLAMIIGSDRKVLGRGLSGGCNYQSVGETGARNALQQALQAARNEWTKQTGYGGDRLKVECAIFGLAGLDTERDYTIMTRLIEDTLKRENIEAGELVIENDARMTLMGATGGKPGILVISGTGSIVCGIGGSGRFARAGGWGHRAGDEGSGFWIGTKAVAAFFKMSDGREKTTLLYDRILPFLDLNNADELNDWMYGPAYSVDKVAELTSIVAACAEEGDEASMAILEEAAEELFSGIRAVLSRVETEGEPVELLLQGGVLSNIAFIRSMLIGKLDALAPGRIRVREDAEAEPIDGIIAMGWRRLSGNGSIEVVDL